MPLKNKTAIGWSVDDIDRMVHEPARYQILSILYVLEKADFRFIMTHTGLTKGNLSSHMSKLEDADYILIMKDFVGRKPHTMMRMTKKGKTAFENYRKIMKRILSG
ncbi:MAG: winged helix-turn-helix domain-containing protein [Thermoplasmatota archaeon]